MASLKISYGAASKAGPHTVRGKLIKKCTIGLAAYTCMIDGEAARKM